MSAPAKATAASVVLAAKLAPPECAKCAALPVEPALAELREPDVEYRPRQRRKVVAGKTTRTYVCATHEREGRRAKSFTARTRAKAKLYGVPRAIQVALWELQGCACPCGRKASPTIPAGVAMHHNRALAALHDHPDEQGCLDCTEGFLCSSCNRDIIGRLERTYRDYDKVLAALTRIRDQIADPPLRRLRRERPELFEEIADMDGAA